MKPTHKVNIGGYAFTMDEDAFHIFNNYFDSLQSHFKTNEECAEIISDIEMRVSELLQMRLGIGNKVVSGKDALEIIAIMGTPSDIGSDGMDTNEERVSDAPHVSDIKKKLYRDTDGAILGGVFGGYGHYFKFDPVALRVIYIALLCLSFSVSAKISFFLVLTYFLMWIIMPKAKTMYEKLAMTGRNPSIVNIEDRVSNNSNKYKGGFIRPIFKAFAYCVFGALGFISLASIVTIIIGFLWLYVGYSSLTLNDYLSVMGLNTFNYKASLLLVLILPFAGILYFSVKVLFRSRLGIRDFVISCVAVLLFLVAGSYLGLKTYQQIGVYNKSASNTELVSVSNDVDTIRINVDKKYQVATPITPYSGGLYVIDDAQGKSFFSLPSVTIVQDSTLQTIRMEIKTTVYEQNKYLAKRKAEQTQLKYEWDSAGIVISPTLYNRDNNWKPEMVKITIYVPSSKSIIVDEMIVCKYN